MQRALNRMSANRTSTNRTSTLATSALFVLTAQLLLVSAASAQQAISERIASVRDGALRLSFPSREGVCGNGSSWIRTRDGSTTGSWNGRNDVEVQCEPGPVRLVIERQGGRTTELRTYVGGQWRAASNATDLGEVAASNAIEYLMREAERGDAQSAKQSLMPLTIADGEVPWPRVLGVARDQSRPQSVRTQALFWAAQAAGGKAADEIGAIARNDPDLEVRKQAVFALSRRDDGVEHLLRIARSSTDREVKKAAYFWLGQSKDPRATELFAEVLGRP